MDVGIRLRRGAGSRLGCERLRKGCGLRRRGGIVMERLWAEKKGWDRYGLVVRLSFGGCWIDDKPIEEMIW
jgi:hypothetical protein